MFFVPAACWVFIRWLTPTLDAVLVFKVSHIRSVCVCLLACLFVSVEIWGFGAPAFPPKNGRDLLFCIALFVIEAACVLWKRLSGVILNDAATFERSNYMYVIYMLPLRILPVCTLIVQIIWNTLFLYEHLANYFFESKSGKNRVWFLYYIANLAFWAIPCREILP